MPRLVPLPAFHDPRGDLSWVAGGHDLPFAIARAYWLTSWTPGVARGVHAHRRLHQLYVAVHGTISIATDDGQTPRNFTLSRPNEGLLLGPMTWRSLTSSDPQAVLLALADGPHDEAEIIRDRATFLDECRP